MHIIRDGLAVKHPTYYLVINCLINLIFCFHSTMVRHILFSNAGMRDRLSNYHLHDIQKCIQIEVCLFLKLQILEIFDRKITKTRYFSLYSVPENFDFRARRKCPRSWQFRNKQKTLCCVRRGVVKPSFYKILVRFYSREESVFSHSHLSHFCHNCLNVDLNLLSKNIIYIWGDI